MVKLIRENTFKNDIVMVDGFGKSGKILMERMLECYEDVEMHIEEEYSQLVYKLHYLKKIDDDTTVSLLRTIFDRKMYNTLLGREINTRFKDDSSIFSYQNMYEYFKRYFLSDKDRDNIIEEANNENKILHIASQDALMYADILFKAFGNRLKIIYIMRNPIEQVYGMKDYRFLERVGRSPSNTIMTYEWNGEKLPLFCLGWEDEYLKMNDIERVIKWDYEVYKRISISLENIPEKYKGNIKIITLDSIVYHKEEVCKLLEEFLGKKATSKIRRIKPNSQFLTGRGPKLKFLTQNISDFYTFSKLCSLYNTLKDKYEILQPHFK